MTSRENPLEPRWNLASLPISALPKLLFLLLVLQLEVLAIVSLWSQQGTVFVQRFLFGMDFHDFMNAAVLWGRGLNPYSDMRFVTPPASLLIGRAGLHWESGAHAFFVVNLVLLVSSLVLLLQTFRVPARASVWVWGIAAAFYPVYFVLERGNLDMLMLFLISLALRVKGPLLQSLAIAVSANLKLYSVLLIAPLARRRQWSAVLGIVTCTILILLPFHSSVLPFLHSLLARGAAVSGTENLSPALILGSLVKRPWGRLAYLALWLLSFFFGVQRFARQPLRESLVLTLPWMLSLPLQVYPYTGVLLLPLLIRHVSQPKPGPASASVRLFFLGFALVGVQQGALTTAFGSLVHSHRFFPFLNALGTLLVLVSVLLEDPSDLQNATHSHPTEPLLHS